MDDPLNTHSYDGKINTSLLSYNILSIEDKQELGAKLLIKAKEVMSHTAVNYLENIISNIGTQSNIDITNNLTADDLIPLCLIYYDNQEFMKILEEQLEDMATGFCPQGRTHRLFQVIVAFQNAD